MSNTSISVWYSVIVMLLIILLICPSITVQMDGLSSDMELCEETETEKESELKEGQDDKLLSSSPILPFTSVAGSSSYLAGTHARTSGPYRDIHSPPPEFS